MPGIGLDHYEATDFCMDPSAVSNNRECITHVGIWLSRCTTCRFCPQNGKYLVNVSPARATLPRCMSEVHAVHWNNVNRSTHSTSCEELLLISWRHAFIACRFSVPQLTEGPTSLPTWVKLLVLPRGILWPQLPYYWWRFRFRFWV